MKSIKMIVPRELIKEFHPHPDWDEPFCHVVILKNGMYTDVWYENDGEYVTTTNDSDLISYIKSQKTKPINFFYRNGVFAFRKFVDTDFCLLTKLKDRNPHTIEFDIVNQAQKYDDLIFYYYLVETGFIKFESKQNVTKVFFTICNSNHIDKNNIEIAIKILKDSLL